jgi:hypothetical protein
MYWSCRLQHTFNKSAVGVNLRYYLRLADFGAAFLALAVRLRGCLSLCFSQLTILGANSFWHLELT